MKIVLAALNAKYVHSNLAVYDLAAYAQKAGIPDDTTTELVIREYTINHNRDQILRSLYQEKAAVVAFSCYIWNVAEVKAIAAELKKVTPDVQIWTGGPEVSYDAENFLRKNPAIDGIMVGEGEATFAALVRKWTAEEAWDPGQVNGICYRDAAGNAVKTQPRACMALDDIPFIYKDLSEFEHKILYYETSRGCPFSCSYCLSSIDKTVRFRSLEKVKPELQFFLDHNVPQVKLIDRTFNCDRKRAMEIWSYITEHDNGVTNFHFEVAADLIGLEECELFSRMRPGLIQLEIGLQSTHMETIREIRRVMDVQKVRDTLLRIRRTAQIHQHLDLIAGLPYEDYGTFIQSFNDAYDMKPNQLQLGFLKVLKGSYMEEQVERYALQYQALPPYEVLSTRWISYDSILRLKQVEEMVEVYYNSAQFEHVLAYIVPLFESAYAFYDELGMYYADRDYMEIGWKREGRYAVLQEFIMNRLEKCDEFSAKTFEDLLRYDYYLRENSKNRPDWAEKYRIENKMYQQFFRNAGTEEYSLADAAYDSKAAARGMHIEPIHEKTVQWLKSYETEWGDKNVEFAAETGKEDLWYGLFDYSARNPLSHAARVTILSHL